MPGQTPAGGVGFATCVCRVAIQIFTMGKTQVGGVKGAIGAQRLMDIIRGTIATTGVSVEILWVASHVGVVGNDGADARASPRNPNSI